MEMPGVRRSSIAGVWYPGDRNELETLIASFTDEASTVRIPGELRALVSPHAGLVYSGRIAAAAYRLLNGCEFDGVVLLGPCHRGGDALAVIPDGAIETPLGTLRVDDELAAALCDVSPEIRARVEPHVLEHSLEVQFPFLQRFLPGVPVAPMLMGVQTPQTIALAADAIESILARAGRKILLIASSDLSHYQPRAVAAELDGRVVDCLERFDVSGLETILRTNPHHACGRGPMLAILTAAAALGATDSRVLAYGDSGDVNGDLDSVVGYASAAVFRKAPS